MSDAETLPEIRLVPLLAAKMERENRRISVAEVARHTKMSRQSAIKWFNNQVKCYPAKTIQALCDYFNCTPNDFIIVKGVEVQQ